ncbi:hypothetical protein EJB05_55712, partial [Eragrostis curvula]
MLRVSYHDVILAWGSVPAFTIDTKRLGRSAAGVASVVAKAEGFVVQEGMRDMIRAEVRALGRAELDVDGRFRVWAATSTAKLTCEPTEAVPPCWVQKAANY